MALLKAVQALVTNSRKGTAGTKICMLMSAIPYKTIGVKTYWIVNVNKMFIEVTIITLFHDCDM